MTPDKMTAAAIVQCVVQVHCHVKKVVTSYKLNVFSQPRILCWFGGILSALIASNDLSAGCFSQRAFDLQNLTEIWK